MHRIKDKIDFEDFSPIATNLHNYQGPKVPNIVDLLWLYQIATRY